LRLGSFGATYKLEHKYTLYIIGGMISGGGRGYLSAL
jgi:hypothetical protein